MSKPQLQAPLLLIFCCFSPPLLLLVPALDCFPPDLHALRSFARHVAINASEAPRNLAEVWGPGKACCSWHGITCLASAVSSASSTVQTPRVFGLSLSDIHAFSTASTSFLEPLCNLSLLSTLYLDMSTDFVSGVADSDFIYSTHIPACLGYVSTLRNLSVISFNLQGPTIPSSFSHLLHLQHLDLSNNQLIRGPTGSLLPITSLPSLIYVDLSGSFFAAPSQLAFAGHLPPFHAPLLQYLDLSYNAFNSTLLDFTLFSELPSLTTLDLSFNPNISGSIPPSIARLSSLADLSLQQCSLSGEFPPSFCNLKKLMRLLVNQNAFTTTSGLESLECEFINLTHLDLSRNSFTGPFPQWIGRSASLQSLDLSDNEFHGLLPKEWMNLQNLQFLDLSAGSSLAPFDHGFGARLPDWLFGSMPLQDLRLGSFGLHTKDLLCSSRLSLLNLTLRTLDLSGNNLTGRDTLECFALHNFTQLADLSLYDNPLSIKLEGVLLPPVSGSLNLRLCDLQGQVPAEISPGFYADKGYSLYVTFAHNNLSGRVPAWIFNSSVKISLLDLSYNNFTTVDVPDNALSRNNCQGSFLHFELVSLAHNALTVDLPSLLASFGMTCCSDGKAGVSESLISEIDLSYNALVGEIPSSLGLCSKQLRRIKIENNRLVGHIPDELGHLQCLYTLTLQNNRLDGTIPACILALSLLTLLDLSHNQLEGNLSTLFPTFSNHKVGLRVLLLSHNHLTGSIPISFGVSMPNLQLVDFSNNKLTGIIPHTLCLPYFKSLNASSVVFNRHKSLYTGALYEEVQSFQKGIEQSYAYVLEVMTSLDLSANFLEGGVPAEIGDLAALRYLNLSHNSLSSSIPSSLAKLSVLEALDLSSNRLEGSLPLQLSHLTKLAVFNVSYNTGLRGKIPKGTQLENSESYKGDPHLCGFAILERACGGEASPTGKVEAAGSGDHNTSKIAGWIDEWIALPGLSLGIVVGFATTLSLLHYKLQVKLFLGRLYCS